MPETGNVVLAWNFGGRGCELTTCQGLEMWYEHEISVAGDAS